MDEGRPPHTIEHGDVTSVLMAAQVAEAGASCGRFAGFDGVLC
jgi:hypothetical protein